MIATKKYNSIENSYQDDFIRSIIEQGFGESEYLVQEKVHGANISFTTDGIEILSAKRTERIVEEEDFYHSKSVLQEYCSKIITLFNDVASQTQATCVTLSGDLFCGGIQRQFVQNLQHLYERLDKRESKAVNKFLNKCAVELLNHYIED